MAFNDIFFPTHSAYSFPDLFLYFLLLPMNLKRWACRSVYVTVTSTHILAALQNDPTVFKRPSA